MILIDCHVHIYNPEIVERALGFALSNLSRIAASLTAPGCAITKAIILTETAQARTYSYLLGTRVAGCFELRPLSNGAAIVAKHPNDGELLIFPAVQLNTREGIEAQLLFSRAESADFSRPPLAEIIQRASQGAAVPLISWAPGKWLFSRGSILEKLFAERPDAFFLADSSMRPRWTPLPRLIRMARTLGRPYLAGTDPLPLPGDERLIGSYATIAPLPLEFSAPAESLLQSLAKAESVAGTRCSIAAACSRWIRHRLSKCIVRPGE